MPSESQRVRNSNHHVNTFLTAQGSSLYRSLTRATQLSLRHYEVAVLEQITGERFTPLNDRSFHYFAVTDDSLYVVERQGSTPKKVEIRLTAIEDVVQEFNVVTAFNEEHIGKNSTRLFLRHAVEAGQVEHLQQYADPDAEGTEDRDQPVHHTQAAMRNVVTDVRCGWFLRHFIKLESADTVRRKAREQSINPGRARESVAAGGPRRAALLRSEDVKVEEVLSVLTIEKSSTLFFHLRQAWLNALFRLHQEQDAKMDAEAAAAAALMPHEVPQEARRGRARRGGVAGAGGDRGRRGSVLPAGPDMAFDPAPRSRSPAADREGEGRTLGVQRSPEWKARPVSPLAGHRALRLERGDAPMSAARQGQRMVIARELFGDLRENILHNRSEYDVTDVRAAMELGAEAEVCLPLKRLFFSSEPLFCSLVSRIRNGVAVSVSREARRGGAALRESHWDGVGWAGASSMERRSSFRAKTARFRDHTHTAGGAHSPARSPARSGEDHSLRHSRVWSSSRGRAGGELDLGMTRSVKMWDRLTLGLLRELACRKAFSYMSWFQKMLENSEGAEERLLLFGYQAPNSVDDLLVAVFGFRPKPPAPREGEGPGPPAAASLTAPPAALVRASWTSLAASKGKMHGDEGTMLDPDSVEGGDPAANELTDLLTGIVYEMEGLAEHAFLHGVVEDRNYLAAVLESVAEADMRVAMCRLFSRMMDLMLAKKRPAGVGAGLVYRTATVLHFLVNNVPSGADHIRQEYEEELKYILSNPEVSKRLGKAYRKGHPYFMKQARKHVKEVVDICLNKPLSLII